MSHNCTAACTAGWPPGGKCHCTECGRNFGSLDIFDRHRKHTQADDQCLDPRKFRDVVLDAAGVFRHRSTYRKG